MRPEDNISEELPDVSTNNLTDTTCIPLAYCFLLYVRFYADGDAIVISHG